MVMIRYAEEIELFCGLSEFVSISGAATAIVLTAVRIIGVGVDVPPEMLVVL